jgi:exodeoxyribonuclease V alpha subunit
MIPLQSRKGAKSTQADAESHALYGAPVIYLTPLYFGEKRVAERLRILANAGSQEKTINHTLFPTENLSEEQQAAVNMALAHPLTILTGGPGTGKTTCLKSLIITLAAQHKRFALASPTGRAAKHLSEATGHPASTIHRLLEYSPVEGFQRNEENPLDLDFLVVDEASMLDLLLTNHLLKAIRPGTHVLFVGDVNSFPPWEPATCSAT